MTRVLFLIASVALAQQGPATGSLEGRVITVSGEPVPRAGLVLRPAIPSPGQGPLQFTFTADDEGKFQWEGIAPGAYSFAAEKPGFVRQYYEARAPGSVGATLTVQPGQAVTGIVMRLSPQAVVTGTVTDPAGDPVAGMQVSLLRPGYAARGVRQMAQAGTADTDDRGNFRISNLPPGRYYLSAGVNEMRSAFSGAFAAGRVPPQAEPEAMVTTYYPGTSSLSTAVLLDVGPGAQVAGVNIRMLKERVYTIRARTVDTKGTLVPNTALAIRSRNDIAMNSLVRTLVPARSRDGQFVFPNLQAGTYIIQARPSVTIPDPNGIPGPPPLTGRVEVTVTDRDVNDVEVRLVSGVEVAGAVRYEEGAAELMRGAPAPSLGMIEYEIPGVNNRGGRANPDGTYLLKDVAPSTYAVTLNPLPAGVYVKSVQFGGQDVTRKPLALTTGGTIDILLSAKAADVSGTIRNSDGRIVSGAAVALWPVLPERSDITGGARVMNSGPDGAFRFDNLPPGEFYLAAWDQAEPGRAENIEFRSLFTEDALKVRLEEGAHFTTDIGPISVERMNQQLERLP